MLSKSVNPYVNAKSSPEIGSCSATVLTIEGFSLSRKSKAERYLRLTKCGSTTITAPTPTTITPKTDIKKFVLLNNFSLSLIM